MINHYHYHPSIYHYYYDGSCYRYLDNVKIPLLMINAIDDPISDIESVPTSKIYSNENLIFVLTGTGGHMGWFKGFKIWKETYADVCSGEFLYSVFCHIK